VHVAPFPQLMPPPLTVPAPATETVSATGGPAVKVAVTLFEAFIRIVQVVDVPPQAPLQPVNAAPVAGVAVSETVSSATKFAEQTLALLPQLISPPSPLMLPLPLTLTVSWTAGAKVAVTDLASSIRTEQGDAVPEHAPPQPVKTWPEGAVAVSSTVEFTACVAAHVDGQLIPPPVIVPLPETETVSSTPVELAQAALTARSPLNSTVQATLVPLQAPPQPVKTLLAAGVSRTVNVEPVSTVHVQAEPTGDEPQSMLPPPTWPVPVVVTESVLVVVGGPLKFAVIVYGLPSTGTSQVLPTGVVGQPVQPSKLQSLAAVAVSVIVPLPENAR
jgi:hypothetical protein